MKLKGDNLGFLYKEANLKSPVSKTPKGRAQARTEKPKSKPKPKQSRERRSEKGPRIRGR
jgi:hypothetical protein